MYASTMLSHIHFENEYHMPFVCSWIDHFYQTYFLDDGGDAVEADELSVVPGVAAVDLVVSDVVAVLNVLANLDMKLDYRFLDYLLAESMKVVLYTEACGSFIPYHFATVKSNQKKINLLEPFIKDQVSNKSDY